MASRDWMLLNWRLTVNHQQVYRASVVIAYLDDVPAVHEQTRSIRKLAFAVAVRIYPELDEGERLLIRKAVQPRTRERHGSVGCEENPPISTGLLDRPGVTDDDVRGAHDAD